VSILLTENSFCFSWTALLTFLALIGAISLSTIVLQNIQARQTVQNALISILDIQLPNSNRTQDEDEKVQVELDEAVESFFRKIIKNFISSWFVTVSRDETFVWNLKQEIAATVRQISVRVKKVSRASSCLLSCY
jgi:hypothetical protein